MDQAFEAIEPLGRSDAAVFGNHWMEWLPGMEGTRVMVYSVALN